VQVDEVPLARTERALADCALELEQRRQHARRVRKRRVERRDLAEGRLDRCERLALIGRGAVGYDRFDSVHCLSSCGGKVAAARLITSSV
jgi:hypothetical protein